MIQPDAGDPAATCVRRKTCRLCGSSELACVLSLTPTPPANAFVSAAHRDQVQETFPIDVAFCRECSHVQLFDVVDPAALFRDYVYVSGTSPAFVRHFQEYAADLVSTYELGRGAFALDIGSNDGTLLQALRETGLNVLGVDPAREIARRASEAGIETWPVFFDADTARRVRHERGPAQCVTANNVFAHIDDLGGTVDAARSLLDPGGVFAIEVSYLADVVTRILFDTIYHEHLDYHALGPLLPFFARHDMDVIDAIRVETHGGSLRIVAQPADGPRPVSERVRALLGEEERLGLDREKTYRDLASRIDDRRDALRELLVSLKDEGKRLAGYGAPAKATTLMHHFGLGPDVIEFIVDDSPWKQGLFSPGLHVPVLSSSEIYERRPDYLVVLAWNFAQPIMEKHQAFRDAGGHFVVPLPELSVY